MYTKQEWRESILSLEELNTQLAQINTQLCETLDFELIKVKRKITENLNKIKGKIWRIENYFFELN